MDIINRNLKTLINVGTWGEPQDLEPMTPYKWRTLFQLSITQQLASVVAKALALYSNLETLCIKEKDVNVLDMAQQSQVSKHNSQTILVFRSRILKRKYNKIIKDEYHVIDTSITTIELLQQLCQNSTQIINMGLRLKNMQELAVFLRKKGHLVDYVKLENWLNKLDMTYMADLQASVLIDYFDFELKEFPFLKKRNKRALDYVFKSVFHNTTNKMEEWNKDDRQKILIANNNRLMRKSVKHNLKFIGYCPLESVACCFGNLVSNLSQIEE